MVDLYKGNPVFGPLAILGPYPTTTREVVKDKAQRNEIPMGVRYEGMEVYIEESGEQFKLVGGVSNDHWVPFNPFLQEIMLQNLLDLVKQVSISINKPLKISNVAMFDLNDDDEVTGIDINRAGGMIYF